MKKIYLDYAATTPTDPRVEKSMQPYFFDFFANPSSQHRVGQEARVVVEACREKVAKFINAEQNEIIFTSGGSEANNLALKGVFYGLNQEYPHFITSKIEHHAILKPCYFLKKQGADITYLSVDKYGVIDLEELKKAIRPETTLISIMFANNEVGTIEPIKQIGKIVKLENEKRQKSENNNPLYFHTDAVQAVGHILIDVNDLGVDLLSASAHKFYGPKGIGFLYVRKGVKLEPLIHGGEHEFGKRASTENIPGIVGLVEALRLAEKDRQKESKRLIKYRDYLIKQILQKIPKSRLNGHPQKRLSNNVNISIEGIEGESMMTNLSVQGIYCSTGSACSSISLEPSHVLMAMQMEPEIAHASLRFSLGRWTKKSDLDITVKKLETIVNRLRNISPLGRRTSKH